MLLNPQVLLSGLFLGALYGLAAIGFQLILGTSGQVYLAYGHLWVVAALGISSLMSWHHLPLPLMFLLLGCLGALAGALLHPGSIWQIARKQAHGRAFFLATLGLALVLEDVGAHLWPLPMTALAWAPAPITLGSVIVPPLKAMVLALVLITALIFTLFLKFHRYGRALRAWDSGNGWVWLMGIAPRRLGRLALSLGLGLAFVAGGFLSLSYTMTIQDGMGMTLRCLVLAVISGTLAPWAVMLTGIGLGMGEAWIGQLAGTQWSPLLGYLLLLVVLPLQQKLVQR